MQNQRVDVRSTRTSTSSSRRKGNLHGSMLQLVQSLRSCGNLSPLYEEQLPRQLPGHMAALQAQRMALQLQCMSCPAGTHRKVRPPHATTALGTCFVCNRVRLTRTQPACAPDGHVAMPQRGDLHVEVDPERAQQAPSGPHEAEDGHVPHIVEHARAIKGQAVRVQSKVAVAPKVRQQNVAGVLLQRSSAVSWLADSASACHQMHNTGLRAQRRAGCVTQLPQSVWQLCGILAEHAAPSCCLAAPPDVLPLAAGTV